MEETEMRERGRKLLLQTARGSIPLFAGALCLSFRFAHFRWQLLGVVLCVLISWGLFCPRWRLVKSRAVTFTVSGLLLCLCGGYLAVSYGLDHAQYQDHHLDRNVFQGKRILVMAPHQDDEINLFGGLYECFEEESDVYVMFSTNGDKVVSGDIRIGEAAQALSVMGVERDHIIFLGYGDSLATVDGTHLYNLPGDQELLSPGGYTQTYGAHGFQPYHHSVYTRDHMKEDLKALLMELRPDVIFCVDYDYHHDHRALSLLFEEAMGEILRGRSADYTPLVFKGFAYSTAYLGAWDFYAENIRSTVPWSAEYPMPGSAWLDDQGRQILYMGENNIYLWEERIRFPVSEKNLSRTLHSNRIYEAMKAHQSQDFLYEAAENAKGIINGDKVFWHRDTSGKLYQAEVEVSSGEGSLLTDFKLVDSGDIIDKDHPPYDNVWVPETEDAQKTATFRFSQETRLDEIRLYDHPSLTENVTGVKILFSDGSEIACGPLRINGSGTSVRFAEKWVTSFTVQLTGAEGQAAGLCEVEAYDHSGAEEQMPQLIKLEDEAGNFAYDYWMTEGQEIFRVYQQGAAGSSDKPQEYTLSALRGDCEIEQHGADAFTVSCRKGQSADLALYLAGKEEPVDLITVRNPYAVQRGWNELLIRAEQTGKFFTPREQYDYFRRIAEDYLGRGKK